MLWISISMHCLWRPKPNDHWRAGGELDRHDIQIAYIHSFIYLLIHSFIECFKCAIGHRSCKPLYFSPSLSLSLSLARAHRLEFVSDRSVSRPALQSTQPNKTLAAHGGGEGRGGEDRTVSRVSYIVYLSIRG